MHKTTTWRRLIQWLIAICAVHFTHAKISLPRVHQVKQVLEAPLQGVDGKNTIILDCIAGGKNYTLSWKFNGTEVTGKEKDTYLQRDNGRLKIEEVTMRNTGSYQCIATNQYGSVFGETSVKVHTFGKFSVGNRKYDPVQSVNGKLGKPLTILCPDHKEGIGQLYWWGDLPSNSVPVLWKAGEPSALGFSVQHGAFVFAYLTPRDAEDVNEAGGISCILYQHQYSIQSVKIKINTEGPDEKLNYGPELKAYMKPIEVAVEGSRDPFFLECGATGRPLPTITWYKDGRLINEDTEGYSLKNNGMTLSFKDPREAFQGMYKCKADNMKGSDEREGRVFVHRKPKLTREIDEYKETVYGKTAEFICEVDAIPVVQYEWFHNDTQIISSDRVKMEKGKLTISSADFHDTGIYMCVAWNIMVEGKQTVVSPGYLKVIALPPKIMSTFQNPEYFFRTFENSLTCEFSGSPKPVVDWSRASSAEPLDEARITDSNGTMVIRDTQRADEGVYQCRGTNVEGDLADTVNVRVVDKVVIQSKPFHRILPVGGGGQMMCDATYDKTLKVEYEWQRDGEPVQENERVYLERRLSGFRKILYLEDVVTTDSGEYSCTVRNTDDNNRLVSQDTFTNTFTVAAPPADLTIRGSCGNDTIILQWKAANYFTARYTVQISDESSDEWTEVLNDVDEDTNKPTGADDSDHFLSVDNSLLPPNANLRYRVAASLKDNLSDVWVKTGESEPTSESCATPIGPPIRNPSNIRSVARKEEQLIIKWDEMTKLEQPGPVFRIIARYREKGSDTWINKPITGDQTQFEIPNPGTSKEYEVEIYTENKEGRNNNVEKETFKSGGLEPTVKVENVRQLAVTPTSVHLAWDLLDYVEGYRVFYPTTQSKKRRSVDDHPNDVTWPSIDVEAVNNATISGLQPKQSYNIALAALHGQVNGPYSDFLVVQTPQQVPSAPLSGNLQVIGDTVHLKWDSPEQNEDRNEGITQYEVTYYETLDPTKKVTVKVNGTEAYISADMRALTYYTFEVTAVSDAGRGEPWTTVGVVVGDPDKPGKPNTPLTETTNNITTLYVTFRLPKKYYGGLPTNFTIYYKNKDSDETAISIKSVYPTKPKILLEDLKQTNYVIWVSSSNAQGVSPPSDRVLTRPTAPKVIPLVVEDESKAFYEEIWFLILLVVLLLLIILAIVLCCILCRRGGKYPVGKKEEKRGGWDGEPLKDYASIPMDDEIKVPVKSDDSPPKSGGDSRKEPFNSDADSLDDYGDDTKFDEDGSFIGEYGDENKRNSTAIV